MKEDKVDTDRKTAEAAFPARKGWIRRLLDWLAKGTQKAVKSGNCCPT